MKHIVVIGIVFNKKGKNLEKIAILHEAGVNQGDLSINISKRAEKLFKTSSEQLHIKLKTFNTERKFYVVIESEDTNEKYLAVGFGDEIEEAICNAENSMMKKMSKESVPRYKLVTQM